MRAPLVVVVFLVGELAVAGCAEPGEPTDSAVGVGDVDVAGPLADVVDDVGDGGPGEDGEDGEDGEGEEPGGTLDAAPPLGAGAGVEVDRECASPPAAAKWTGSASLRAPGPGGERTLRAEVEWHFASRSACIDKYRAHGVVTLERADGCGLVPGSAPIDLTDGLLAIDRTTSPPTYWMNGASGWSAIACNGAPPATVGGRWVGHGGVLVGDVLRGAADVEGHHAEWSFVAADAVAPPPPDGCVGAPVDDWTAQLWTSSGVVAAVAWTRTGTDGCVDRYRPSGQAHGPVSLAPGCAESYWNPPSAPVAVDDGVLEIDRTTRPPTFRVTGRTEWTATVICVSPDGEVDARVKTMGGDWAAMEGVIEGDHAAGAAVLEPYQLGWSLTRIN